MNSEQIKRAIELLKELLNPEYEFSGKNTIQMNDLLKDMEQKQNALHLAIEYMEKELDRQENKALTLSELKEMVGEPVYIFELDRWGVIGEKECVSFGNDGRKEFNRFVIGFSYGYEWLDDFANRTFYKHKPTEGVGI